MQNKGCPLANFEPCVGEPCKFFIAGYCMFISHFLDVQDLSINLLKILGLLHELRLIEPLTIGPDGETLKHRRVESPELEEGDVTFDLDEMIDRMYRNISALHESFEERRKKKH